MSKENVLTDQAVSGLARPDIVGSHATGSALDLRSTVLLDPSKLLLHGERDMRRRGSEINRVRPTVVADNSDSVELATFGAERRSLSDAVPVLDLESAPGSSGVSMRASTTREDENVTAASSAVPLIPPAERRRQRRKGLLCFATLCWSFFLIGWNDGSTGPLLPTIQRHYNIGFAIVSLLFVSNTIGYIIGALANVYLTDRLGIGKVLALGSMLQVVAYTVMAPGGPFPLMCLAFGFAGFALALQTSQANGFVGCLGDPSTKLGLLHAAYGLGAFSAPLVATHFAQQERWSFHYLISLGIAISNFTFLMLVFGFKNQDQLMAEAGEAPSEVDMNGGSKYKQIFGITALHYLTLWAVIYVGVEVTLGGWIVTYIQQKRGGGASAGYISSGFFGGLMTGRVTLMWLNRKIGERRVMFIYAFLAIQLEVTVWVVPSLVENAVAVSVIGLLLGPMYPILVNHAKGILPKWLFTGCVGWISGLGQAGAAILPFITGLLASRFGITSLQPFIVSMMSTMIVIWALIPRVRRID